MDPRKYNKSISLPCSCGSTDFSTPEQADDKTTITCAKCGRETTRTQLIAANKVKIDAEVKKVGKAVVADVRRELQKSLSDAFKGNRHIKFKL